jgi:hypothetical protein
MTTAQVIGSRERTQIGVIGFAHNSSFAFRSISLRDFLLCPSSVKWG